MRRLAVSVFFALLIGSFQNCTGAFGSLKNLSKENASAGLSGLGSGLTSGLSRDALVDQNADPTASSWAIRQTSILIHSAASGIEPGYSYTYAPTIIKVGNIYHAYFCSSGVNEDDWDHVRHSTSTDLVHWSSPKTVATSTVKERANCDPSVILFDAGDGPFYYLMFSGCPRGIQTANFLARAASPDGPFLKLTDRGTWENQPVDSRIIAAPLYPAPDNSGIYGAGQPSMVVRNGEVLHFYNDTTRGGPNTGSDRVMLMRSRDMVHWSAPVETNARAGSMDVKFDPERNAFVMFDLDQDHQENVQLTLRVSPDGVAWSEPRVICQSGCLPHYANNVGVSGDSQGHLIPGDDLLVAYGAPPNLSPAYSNDCSVAPGNCWGNWDLAGQILSKRLIGGILQTADALYFYNGVDALCHIATMDDLGQIGVSNLQFMPSLPSSVRNDGTCVVKQHEGFFSNGAAGIFYSNGVDAFCHVSNPDDMANFIRMRGTDAVVARTSFPNMRRDGECAVPEPVGLFSNGAEGIFFSNGGDAFCHVANPDDLTVFSRRSGLSAIKSRTTFPNMRRDGSCAIAPDLGFFSVNGAIYFSNGNDAFCYISTPERLANAMRVLGTTVITARTWLPSIRNDGTCQ